LCAAAKRVATVDWSDPRLAVRNWRLRQSTHSTSTLSPKSVS